MLTSQSVNKSHSFNDLSLSKPITQALEKLNFTVPTPIQAAAIPAALSKRDLIACAQTGTGKTAAFVIPLIAKILVQPKSKALIVTPTRELALQVAKVVFDLTAFCQQIRSATIIGGASMHRQLRDLQRSPSILIGTPGRIVDHLNRQSLDLKKYDTLVLDEADRMFDMGFADVMNRIFDAFPEERQTLLFSATFSPQVLKLTRAQLRNPERVTIGQVDRPIERIEQIRVDVQNDDKNEMLLKQIENCAGQTIVFLRTKHRTDRMTRFLNKSNVQAVAIHGGLSQSQRRRALEDFRSGEFQILCATDVASRGLDIQDIGTVFNVDLPETSDDYIHRIGRTARAGAKGRAISFVTREEQRHWNYLIKDRDGEKMNFMRGKGRGDKPKQSSSQPKQSSRHKRFGKVKSNAVQSFERRQRKASLFQKIQRAFG